MNGVWYAAVVAVFVLGLLFLRVYATRSRAPQPAPPASSPQADVARGAAATAETDALRRAAEDRRIRFDRQPLRRRPL